MADWSRSSRQQESAIEEELIIVLLGSDADVKASCMNTIFGRNVSSESSHLFEKHNGMALNRHVVIVNTPDLLSPALSPEKQELKKFLDLFCPGPYALLLALRSGSVTEQVKDALDLIDISFGAGASEYVIVVFMHEEQMKDESVTEADSRSEETPMQIWRRPHHHLERNGDQSQVLKLLEDIEKMVEDKRGQISDDAQVTAGQTKTKNYKGLNKRGFSVNQRPAKQALQPKSENARKLVRSNSLICKEKSLECVRIVLVGKTGVGKSATGNTILGRNVFESRARMCSTTKTCQRKSGDACGRAVAVVDTPGLFDTRLSNEEIQQEIMRCIKLSAPGPHVFLLVIAVGPITQEERETLQLIQMTFGQKAEAFTMVLFTRGDSLGDEKIEDYVKEGDPQVQKLIQDCGGRFHMLNNIQKNSGQVMSLLKKIDKMMWNNNCSFYNDKMFQEAETAFRLMQINREKEEEVKREMDAFKAKYESEIEKYKEKLQEERAKGKVREFLLLARENTLLRKYQMRLKTEDTETTDSEQTQEECQPTDQIIKQEDQLSGPEGETTERTESDKSQKKHKKWRGLETLKRKKKEREKLQRMLEECKVSESASGEENKSKEAITDQQIETDLPENSKDERDAEKEHLLQQYKEMEECRQMLNEAMRKYKETADTYAAELRKIEARNTLNIDNWEKSHGKQCVLQ